MTKKEELIKCIGDIHYGGLKDDFTHTSLKEIITNKLIHTIADSVIANGWIKLDKKDYDIPILKSYHDSLLSYWKNGHGDFSILIAEYQGFIECLIELGFMPPEDYGLYVDNFIEELKKVRKPK